MPLVTKILTFTYESAAREESLWFHGQDFFSLGKVPVTCQCDRCWQLAAIFQARWLRTSGIRVTCTARSCLGLSGKLIEKEQETWLFEEGLVRYVVSDDIFSNCLLLRQGMADIICLPRANNITIMVMVFVGWSWGSGPSNCSIPTWKHYFLS